MEFETDARSNRTVIHCSGALEQTHLREFEDTLAKALAGDARPIYVDMSAVTIESSPVILALRKLLQRLNPPDAREAWFEPPRLRVVNVHPDIQAILDPDGVIDGHVHSSSETAYAPTKRGQTYAELLPAVQDFFPSPVSDPMRDAYFVQSVARALDRLDDLKTARPYIGERMTLDYTAARLAQMPERMSTLEGTLAEMVNYLQGLVIWGHPHTQENVVPPCTIASIIGQLFGSVYNPNIIWDEYSHRTAQAEVEATAMCASLVGYEPEKAAGIFTFGGTGTILYGAKVGLEKAQPGAMAGGVRAGAKIVGSTASHYAKTNVAGWLGLGTENVVAVPTDPDNSISLEALEATLEDTIAAGHQVACIIATMGTTDAFAIDDLAAIVALRDRMVEKHRLPYRPHVHADAVIGWAWAVFNDYDFRANRLGFSAGTLRSLWDARAAIQKLHLADSIGVDFHKTGYGPYVSSLVLYQDGADLELITRDKDLMPYLFQFGNYHPGVFTLETSRFGGAVLASLANLKLLGRQGYQVLLGHIVTMAERLRAALDRVPWAVVVNDYNHGPVTLFRVYPDGVAAAPAYRAETSSPEHAGQLAAHSEYNRRIFRALYAQMEEGTGMALSLTEAYRHTAEGNPILALKSYVMSPMVSAAAMDHLVECLERARRTVGGAAE